MSVLLGNTTGEAVLLEVANTQRSRQESTLKKNYVIVLENGDDGWVIAECKELNVATQGKTESEATQNAIEAMSLMAEELGKEKEFTTSIRKKVSV